METVRQLAEEVAGKIKGYLPDGYGDMEYEIVEMPKNNGVYWTGVRFRRAGETDSAIIYMEPYLNGYKRGMSFDKVMEDIAEKITECAEVGFMDLVLAAGKFENIKGSLELALVNTRANRKQLTDIPHFPMEDLSVACRIAVPMKEGQGSIQVTESHLKSWGIGKEQLFQQALVNMQRPGMCTLQGMDDVMLELTGELPPGNLLEAAGDAAGGAVSRPELNDGMMFVLTTKSKNYGASAMACPDVMGKVDRLFPEGFYLLPSSVHECLVIRKDGGVSVKDLEQMVFEVNRTAVEEHERLSDHVYEYDRERQSIRLASKGLEKERGMER